MRGQYVHEASLLMSAGSDPGAPGAAITLELCGCRAHDMPCPLAPHHTEHTRDGNAVTLRTVFVAEPDEEDQVRRRIEKALAAGSLTGPGGVKTNWILQHAGSGVLTETESGRARRMAAAIPPAESWEPEA